MRKALEFLYRTRSKTLRTALYGDLQFTPFELELLHTPSFQRLYDLKQLGFADRVFPDAVHSRFNHVLGVVYRVEQMTQHIFDWLRLQGKPGQLVPETFDAITKADIPVTSDQLFDILKRHLPALRLVALLHDLTHAPYGHTLEDELGLFESHHDDPVRQCLFFDGLFFQLAWSWSALLGFSQGVLDPSALSSLRRLRLSGASKGDRRLREELDARFEYVCSTLTVEERDILGRELTSLEFAFVALFHLGDLLASSEARPPLPELELTRQLARLSGLLPRAPLEAFDPHKHAFLIDLVGNTICADLLDYTRRDSYMAGLKPNFDDRVMRYLVLVSFNGLPSQDKGRREFVTDQKRIRLATQFYTNKMRHDVLSELSTILKARYLISESILLHPTKCAAGAMLGSALQLLGLRTLPDWILTYGDSELLDMLDRVGKALEDFAQLMLQGVVKATAWSKTLPGIGSELRKLVVICLREIAGTPLRKAGLTRSALKIRDRARAARRVLWLLRSRRMPGLIYRIRSGVQLAESINSATVARTYAVPDARYALERRIEEMSDLPLGSIFVHCPTRSTTLKVARALVVGKDLSRSVPLREVASLGNRGDLEPYQAEVNAIEDMYDSIWKLHIFMDSAYADASSVAAGVAEKVLKIPNDPLLEGELAADERNEFDLLSDPEYGDEIAFNELPRVLRLMRQLRQEGEGVRLKVGSRKRTLSPEQIVREAIHAAKLEHPAVGVPTRRRKRKDEGGGSPGTGNEEPQL